MVIRVKVPATTANIGPGFDCLGLALNVWNEVRLEVASEFSLSIEGEGESVLPRDATNLVCQAVELVLAEARSVNPELGFPTFRYGLTNRIPFARGMGSSSAAIVSGLLAAFEYLRELGAANLVQGGHSPERLLELGCRLENHPDNLAPCIYGGLQLGFKEGSSFRSVRLRYPLDLGVLLFVPNHPSSTEEARRLVPNEYTREQAEFNISRIALLVNAFSRDSLCPMAMEDALHQPQRAVLHPHLYPIMEAAKSLDSCLGASLSGAGSTVLVFVKLDPMRQEATRIGQRVLQEAAKIGCPGRVIITHPVSTGGSRVQE